MFHEMVVGADSDSCSKVTVPEIFESPRICATALTIFGGTWEIYLKEIEEQESLELGEGAVDSEDKLETPLEVVVDKCIVQEVLSQYNCISYFTVRLLLEIFGLQDHLSALRRYFFMDRGDWAENFASALYQHVWYPAGPQQRLVEVQGILETALQNSSCEDDEYADKLLVYIEGCERMEAEYSPVAKDEVGHTYVNKNCVTAFDFIMLEYKVEWPISLILTSESFKLYNSIFSFLLRAKLTIHALGDLWRCLKASSGLKFLKITYGYTKSDICKGDLDGSTPKTTGM